MTLQVIIVQYAHQYGPRRAVHEDEALVLVAASTRR